MPPTASGTSPGSTLGYRRLQLGVQVGAHLQVSKLAALYGDVTLDYNGQWRLRFGIAIDEPGRG